MCVLFALQFGEQWNVTWSQLQRLTELEVVRPGAAARLAAGAGDAAESSEGEGTPAEGASGGTGGVGLVVGPDLSLRQFDRASGWERWAHKFDAVPIAAYSSAGGRTDLLARPQQEDGGADAGAGEGAQQGGGSKSRGLPLPGFLEKAWKGATGSGSGAGDSADQAAAMPNMCANGGPDQVLLGIMGGSLFGIPASHLTFDASEQFCQVGSAPLFLLYA